MAAKVWLQEQGCSFGGVSYVDVCFSNPRLKPWPAMLSRTSKNACQGGRVVNSQGVSAGESRG